MPTREAVVPGLTSDGAGTGRRRRRWVGRLVIVLLLAGVGVGGYIGTRGVVKNFGGPMCQAVALGDDVRFDPEQTANAATITALALRRGLPARAATIALATAIQESGLRNLDYGDRDSLGLFQQRPSQGWGTPEQVRDPVYAAGKFYDALVKIKGYETATITEVAQKVQRSAYPGAYADHEQEGRILASTLAGHSPGGVACRLDGITDTAPDPSEVAGGWSTSAADGAADVVTGLRKELAVSGKASSGQPSMRTVTVTAKDEQLAWAAGAWAVAHAARHRVISVTVGDLQWTRTRDEAGWRWSPAKTPTKDARSVVITTA